MSKVTNPVVAECRRALVEYRDSSSQAWSFGCSEKKSHAEVLVCASEDKSAKGCMQSEASKAPWTVVCADSKINLNDKDEVKKALEFSKEKFCDKGKCQGLKIIAMGTPLYMASGVIEYTTPESTGVKKSKVPTVLASTLKEAKENWCKKAIDIAPLVFMGNGGKTLLRKTLNDGICNGIEDAAKPSPRPSRCVDGNCTDESGKPIPEKN
ncbi:MAG TPA: hypothetical protein PLZ86_07410 [bacterium]|nr:hypothetical protein [bacterium]